jgi:hypothetical protein
VRRALSLLAGLIHLWVTPEHFEGWWGYGAFFLVAGAAQILYAPIVLLIPTRIVLLLGIAGNLAIVVLYLLTRTVGIPFFGPEAGEVEGFGFVDVCATASEVGIAVALGAALLRNASRELWCSPPLRLVPRGNSHSLSHPRCNLDSHRANNKPAGRNDAAFDTTASRTQYPPAITEGGLPAGR